MYGCWCAGHNSPNNRDLWHLPHEMSVRNYRRDRKDVVLALGEVLPHSSTLINGCRNELTSIPVISLVTWMNCPALTLTWGVESRSSLVVLEW